MLRRLRQHDLECRPDAGFHKVAAARGAVRAADDDVSVDLRLCAFQRNVPGQYEDLDLLLDRDLLVLFPLAVEISHGGPLECPDRGEMAGVEALLSCKRGQR